VYNLTRRRVTTSAMFSSRSSGSCHPWDVNRNLRRCDRNRPLKMSSRRDTERYAPRLSRRLVSVGWWVRLLVCARM
jgi:hypothetical protein